MTSIYQRPVCGVWIEGESWQDCLPQGWGELAAPIDARMRNASYPLEEVTRALQFSRHAGASAPAKPKGQAPTLQPRNPYKGLQAFREEDRHDFFGRDVLIDELTHELEACLSAEQISTQGARLLAVIGPSGSSKSSLVLAGLLPHLQAGGLPGSEKWIYLNPLVPGVHPIESLALALSAQLP